MFLARLALFVLLPAFSIAQSRPTTDPMSVPRAVIEAATNILGPGATILQFGHLSAPDQNEAVAAVTASAESNPSGAVTVSKLVILRDKNSGWTPDLKVDKVIRNSQGFLGATSIDQLRPSALYKVSLFTHQFDDGKNRFVIQLTPADADGRPTGASVYVSWNPLVGRYQQISLQGYGFDPEIHEPLPSTVQ
jgi:hypothetical protein